MTNIFHRKPQTASTANELAATANRKPQTASRTAIVVAVVAVGLALIALLAYSLDRTAWLFQFFEQGTGDWGDTLGLAAAVVVELAAVALVAGEAAVSHLDRNAIAWANRSLVLILAVQWIANLIAGFLRGGIAAMGLFGDTAATMLWIGPDARYAVAATMWLLTNSAIPGLVFCLAKLMAILIRKLIEAPQITTATPTATTEITITEGGRKPQVSTANRDRKPQPVLADRKPQTATTIAVPQPQTASTASVVAVGEPQTASVDRKPQTVSTASVVAVEEPQTASVDRKPQTATATTFAVPAEKLAVYRDIVAAYKSNHRTATDELAAAVGLSPRTIETRRSELVKAGVLARKDGGFTMNGVQLVEE